jgi:hypothetical protein
MTPVMIRPTEPQSMRTSEQIADLSIWVARNPTRSSESAVKRDPARAKGTASVIASCVGQTSRRNVARTSRRQHPRSRCRQVDSTGRMS